MLRKSLLGLIEVSRSTKVALSVASYEVHDYEDSSYTELRLNKVVDVAKLARLTKGFEVNIYADSGQIIIRIHENYQQD